MTINSKIDILTFVNILSLMESKQIVKISKALADENRQNVFRTIAQKGEIVCKEITNLFNLSQPTISHHLKILVESGLVNVRKEGQWSYFSVNKKFFREYLSSLRNLTK